jgi:hypothetical protein
MDCNASQDLNITSGLGWLGNLITVSSCFSFDTVLLAVNSSSPWVLKVLKADYPTSKGVKGS